MPNLGAVERRRTAWCHAFSIKQRWFWRRQGITIPKLSSSCPHRATRAGVFPIAGSRAVPPSPKASPTSCWSGIGKHAGLSGLAGQATARRRAGGGGIDL